jgi:hypothetical protein
MNYLDAEELEILKAFELGQLKSIDSQIQIAKFIAAAKETGIQIKSFKAASAKTPKSLGSN